jgi:magnesium transporter
VPTALLFDRDRVDAVDDWEHLIDRLGRRSILWIDLESPDQREADDVVEHLDLSSTSGERLVSTSGTPFFGDFGTYIHVTAYAPCGDVAGSELSVIECLVSKHWIVTAHDQPVPVIDQFRELACDGSGETGKLDGLEFLANLLEWVLHAYHEAFDAIEDELGELDSRTMEGGHEDPEAVLGTLVDLRRRVSGLRKALVSHREMFLALTRPELEAIASSDHGERFVFLRTRLEEAVQSARDSRDSIVGSFDVLIARTNQRTNEIMKVLTLGSLLFLPGAFLAGVLGMNFEVGLFDHTALFWVVVGFMISLMVAVLVAARVRKWI